MGGINIRYKHAYSPTEALITFSRDLRRNCLGYEERASASSNNYVNFESNPEILPDEYLRETLHS
jgi:hypothetical protein